MVVGSAFGRAPDDRRRRRFVRWLARRRGIDPDAADLQARLLSVSGIAYTLVRVPNIDDRRHGRELAAGARLRVGARSAVNCDALVDFMLDQVGRHDLVGRTPIVVGGRAPNGFDAAMTFLTRW